MVTGHSGVNGLALHVLSRAVVVHRIGLERGPVLTHHRRGTERLVPAPLRKTRPVWHVTHKTVHVSCSPFLLKSCFIYI